MGGSYNGTELKSIFCARHLPRQSIPWLGDWWAVSKWADSIIKIFSHQTAWSQQHLNSVMWLGVGLGDELMWLPLPGYTQDRDMNRDWWERCNYQLRVGTSNLAKQHLKLKMKEERLNFFLMHSIFFRGTWCSFLIVFLNATCRTVNQNMKIACFESG